MGGGVYKKADCRRNDEYDDRPVSNGEHGGKSSKNKPTEQLGFPILILPTILKSVFSIVGKIRIGKPSCSVGLFLLLFPPCSPFDTGRSSYSSLRRQSAFLYTPPPIRQAQGKRARGVLILSSGSTSPAGRTWSTTPTPPRWAR